MAFAALQGLFLDREGHVRNGWKATGGFALAFLFVSFADALHRLLPAEWKLLVPRQGPETAAVLAAAWICLRAEGRGLPTLGLRIGKAFLWDFAVGAGLGAGLILATALAILAFGGFHWTRTPGPGAASLLQGAWLFFAVAWFEETLFRGYAFQRAVHGLGFTGAQALFALLFAWVHWGNPGLASGAKPLATLNIALAALLLGLGWRRTGSLALPIGLHFGWNWTQGSLLGFRVSGVSFPGLWTPVLHDRPGWLTGGSFGLEASLACVLVCGAAVLGLWRWRGRVSAGDSTASAS